MVVTGVNMLLGGRADGGRGSRGARATCRSRSCSRPRTVAASWTTTSC
jgi:hypothetical protein